MLVVVLRVGALDGPPQSEPGEREQDPEGDEAALGVERGDAAEDDGE